MKLVRNLLCVLAISLTGCIGSPQKNQPKVDKQTNIVETSEWKAQIPSGFNVVVSPSNPLRRDDVVVELQLISNDPIESDKIAIAVVKVPWSKEDSKELDLSEFPKLAVYVIVNNEDNDVKGGKEISFQDRPSTLVYYVNHDGMFVIQIATVSNTSGYIIRCGGNEDNYRKVVLTCRDALQNFAMK